MTDEAYKSAQDKADDLSLSFSSYMSMLAKKDLKGVVIKDKPIVLHTPNTHKASDIAKGQMLCNSISKWLADKGISDPDNRKCDKIVNKILEETK